MSEIKIGSRLVGDGHPCLISLEPGATHTGLESAKALTKAAADSGADAIKFQTMTSDKLMATRDTQIEYDTVQGTKKESVYEAMKRRELTPDEWKELKKYADGLGLLFISAPSDKETVDLLVEMDVAAIKVAKSDINYFPLVDYIARQGKPVILDGRERFEDVQKCVEICESHECTNILIMHCPSGYPSKHAGVHLSAIPHIKGLFKYPVGYSDHSVGTNMNYAALALGASLIEKTVTLDRNTDAVEHYMSLEPGELADFVTSLREVESALGDPRIIFSSRVNPELRRSIFAGRLISRGEVIQLADLDFRRPGIHLSVGSYQDVIGKQVNKDLNQGDPIQLSDIE